MYVYSSFCLSISQEEAQLQALLCHVYQADKHVLECGPEGLVDLVCTWTNDWLNTRTGYREACTAVKSRLARESQREYFRKYPLRYALWVETCSAGGPG